MEFLTQLEKTALGWFRSAPHLPPAGQKWLGDNVWWITLIIAILTGLGVLATVGSLLTLIAVLGGPAGSYYVAANVTNWAIVTAIVSIAFSILEAILLAVAVQPLKAKQKKGWVLLFAIWLLGIFVTLVNAVLTLSIVSFIVSVLFGGVFIAIVGYFLFEIHGQFAHVERSNGVKSVK